MPALEFLSLTGNFLVLSDNTIVPVVQWFDDYGEECEASEAEAFLAGPYDGKWLSVDLMCVAEFEAIH